MKIVFILVGASKLDDVWLTGEVLQDHDLASHVFDVFLTDEFAFRDRFACVLSAVGFVSATVRDAELAAAEFFVEVVESREIDHWSVKDWTDL